MPRPHDRLLRVFSWVVLLSALVTVACDKPPTSRHAVLGDWQLGLDETDLWELKFFPNGKCRFTQGGHKMPFCGWDPDGEERIRLRLAGPLPTGRGRARVAGDELIVELGNSSSTWVRVGSKREEKRVIAEWTPVANGGDRSAQNNLAWLFAAVKDPKYHDGKKAVAYAEMAVAQERKPAYLDTLAAALARDGQFEKAVQVQEEVLSLLEKDSSSPIANDETAMARFKSRLALYKAGQAYTEP